MQLPWTEYLGFAAGAITTGAYVPQVWRAWRRKDVKDVSLAATATLILGVILWLVYGVFIRSWAVSAANAASLALLMSLLRMKVVYGQEEKAEPRSAVPPRA